MGSKLTHALLLLFSLFVLATQLCSEPPQAAGNQEVVIDEHRIRWEREMAKQANLQRQAELERDTQKLVTLTNDLKRYVVKSNAHILSVEVVKKAEQIEKLAHTVKEKMRGSN